MDKLYWANKVIYPLFTNLGKPTYIGVLVMSDGIVSNTISINKKRHKTPNLPIGVTVLT